MNVGLRQERFNAEFTDTVGLPGTTDLNEYSFPHCPQA